MKRQGLLLQRNSGRRKGRLHDGKVVVMRSNLRWCSDVFEINCRNTLDATVPSERSPRRSQPGAIRHKRALENRPYRSLKRNNLALSD
jgi:hypothetical protein